MNDELPVVAQRLRTARERKNLKQTQVMKRTGINNKTLSGYENGVSEPDLETIKILAELYEVTVDWLSGRDKNIIQNNEQSGEEDFDKWMEIYQSSSPEERKLILQHAAATLEIIRRK